MLCAGENRVQWPQLLDPVESLENRGIHKLEFTLIEFDVAVHGIVDPWFSRPRFRHRHLVTQ